MEWGASTILTVVGTVVTTILGVSGTVWVAKTRARVDISAAITNGFDALTNQLQEERAYHTEVIRQKSAEIAAAEAVIREQRRLIYDLEDILARNGFQPPPRRSLE